MAETCIQLAIAFTIACAGVSMVLYTLSHLVAAAVKVTS